MIDFIKARTSVLALILAASAVGYTVAATNKVVVVPMAGDALNSRWALINGVNGAIIAGSAGVTANRTSPGGYHVSFDKSVKGHAILTTAQSSAGYIQVKICGTGDSSGETYGCIAPYNSPSHVRVETRNVNGTLTDKAFYIAALP